MKLAEALAIKAREQGIHHMAVLPKLSKEERRERQAEWSRQHRQRNRERLNEEQRERYAAKREVSE